MNIVKRELRSHIKSLAIWSGSILFFMAIAMSEFTAYKDNPAMAEALLALPEKLMAAFSMNTTNFSTLDGFMGIMMVYIFIALSIHAVMLGSSILVKEERDKTADFLFSLPVSRTKVLISKLIAAIICLIIMLIMLGIISTVTVMQYSPDMEYFKFLGLALIAQFILQLLFMSIGMLLGSLMKNHKKAGSMSSIIVLGAYIISILVGLSDKIEFLKYFSPFMYFKVETLPTDGFRPVYLIISAVVITICMIGVFIAYPKRNLGT